MRNFIQRHINFESTNERDGNIETETISIGVQLEWKRAEIVAREISPVRMRCDSCVTDSFFFLPFSIPPSSPRSISVLRCCYVRHHVSVPPLPSHHHCGDVGGGLGCFPFSKITVKVTASHVMSGEKHFCHQRNLPLVHSKSASVRLFCQHMPL